MLNSMALYDLDTAWAAKPFPRHNTHFSQITLQLPLANYAMTSATLLDLPTELVQDIQSQLPYASHLALRFTCRDLYFKTDDPNKTRKYSNADLLAGKTPKYSMSDLLEIETWPRYNHAAQRPEHLKQAIAGVDFFSCNQCLRIRSAFSFSNAMMKGRYGKGRPGEGRPGAGLSWPTAKNRLRRMCIQCAIEEGTYGENCRLTFGGTQCKYGTVVWHDRNVVWQDRKLQLRVDVKWCEAQW
jgi:hypothetical protein